MADEDKVAGTQARLPVDWIALAVAFALVAAVRLGLLNQVPW